MIRRKDRSYGMVRTNGSEMLLRDYLGNSTQASRSGSLKRVVLAALQSHPRVEDELPEDRAVRLSGQRVNRRDLDRFGAFVRDMRVLEALTLFPGPNR